MSGYYYDLLIDRADGVFDVGIGYFIDTYFDPETGEEFSDTSWSVTILPGGNGTGGYAGPDEFINLSLGLNQDGGLHQYQLQFFAQNTFSAESVSFI